MRLILRVIGTWLLALALILLIVDGTKSLSANGVILTALGDSWTALNADSLAAARGFFASRFFGPMLGPGFEGLVKLPGWIVLGVPGVILAAMGRSRRTRLFVRQDQI
jgi:hypothetical protein